MNNKKILSTVLVSSIILSSGAIQTSSFAYANQMEHVADMINQSSELTVSGPNLHKRKITDAENIQKIVDVYKNAKKEKTSSFKIKDFDLKLYFPGDVKIELVRDKNLGRCAIGDSYEYFKTDENIVSQIETIINATNKYIEFYSEGEIIKEGDPVVSSVELSKATYPQSENVIITGPKGTPDSLASAPLAGYLSAPILITTKDRLRPEVESEIKRLGAKNIYFTSGNNVVSADVKIKLKNNGYNVVDLSASDRYKTAENISRFILERSNKSEKTILINGENYADAPSISAFAFREQAPILLTNGRILRKDTFNIIKRNKNLLIVGGKDSIPYEMENKLNDNLINVGRLQGKDRYETSFKIVSGLFANNNKLLVSDGKEDLGAGIIAAGYCVANKRPLIMVKKGLKENSQIKKRNLLYLTEKAYKDIN